MPKRIIRDARGRKVGETWEPDKPIKKQQGGNVATDANRPQNKTKLQKRSVSAPSPDDRGFARETEIHPQLPARREPPVPVLQKYGFHGTLDEFSGRLNMATTMHENIFGYKPTPGLAFDMARSNVPEEKFADLFSIPKMGKKMAEAAPLMGQFPQETPEQIKLRVRKDLTTAITEGDFSKWISQPENIESLHALRYSTDPEDQAWLDNAVDNAYAKADAERAKEYKSKMSLGGFSLGGEKIPLMDTKLPKLGVPKVNLPDKAKYIPIVTGVRAAYQIDKSLVQSVPAVYVFGNDARMDLNDLYGQRREGKYPWEKNFEWPTRTQRNGAAMIKSYKERYGRLASHPSFLFDQPGYFLMDGLTVLTGGAGAASRVGALGETMAARGAMEASVAAAAKEGNWAREAGGTGRIFTQPAAKPRFVKGNSKKARQFETRLARYAKLAKEAERDTRTPEGFASSNRRKGMTDKQLLDDYRAESRARGYTEQEINDYITFQKLRMEGVKKHGYTQDEIFSITHSAYAGDFVEPFVKPSRVGALLRKGGPEILAVDIAGQGHAAINLSDNPLIRAAQKWRWKGREDKLNRHHLQGQKGMVEPGEVESLESMHTAMFQSSLDFFHDQFSVEAKYRRRLEAQGRYLEILELTPKRQLEALAGRSIQSARAWGAVPQRMRIGLSAAQNKAIEVMATDSTSWNTALADHRKFHEWAIEHGKGYTSAHRAHLKMLDGAEKVLANPDQWSDKFRAIYQLTRQVAEEQQRLKIEHLGLDPLTAENRIAGYGQILRGETFHPAAGTGLKKLQIDVKNLKQYLAGEGHLNIPEDVMTGTVAPLKAKIAELEAGLAKHLDKKQQNEPPVPEGHVRVYRGENRKQKAEGAWYTTDPKYADKFANEFDGPGGKTRYIDLTLEEAKKYFATGTKREGEWIDAELPPEILKRGKHLEKKTEAPKVEAKPVPMAISKVGSGHVKEGDLIRRGKDDFKKVSKIDNREKDYTTFTFEDGTTRRVKRNFIRNIERQNERAAVEPDLTKRFHLEQAPSKAWRVVDETPAQKSHARIMHVADTKKQAQLKLDAIIKSEEKAQEAKAKREASGPAIVEGKNKQVERVGREAAKADAEKAGVGYMDQSNVDELAVSQMQKDLRDRKKELAEIESEYGVLPKPTGKKEIEKVENDIAALEAGIAELQGAGRQSETSFYVPSQRKARSRLRMPRGRPPVSYPYGITPPRDIPDLNHILSGSAMVYGDTRIDIPHLEAEAYGRVAKAMTVKTHYDKLWKLSTTNRRTARDIVIRDIRTIPDALRRTLVGMDDGIITNKDAYFLPEDTKELLEGLFPKAGTQEAKEIGPHVRYLDPALVGELHEPSIMNTKGKYVIHALDVVNAPARATILYLRPAYAFNFLSNIAMGLFSQGHWVGPNMVKAMNAERLYGATARDTLATLVGEGRSKAYIAPESPLGKVGGHAARFWSKVTDEHLRMSALIHELNRHEFDIDKLNHPHRMTPEDKRIVASSAEVANKNMVQFDNLLPLEKEVLRHMIFVYPWVSRSTVWSLRTTMEHPIKVNLLTELGKSYEEVRDNDPILKYAPDWYKRTGYTPVGWKGDKPIVVNPTTINNFATSSSVLALGEDTFFHNVQYTSPDDILSPGARMYVHGITGRDDYGNEYPDPTFWAAAQELLVSLPQLRAVAGNKDKPGAGEKPLAIEDINTLVKREHAAMKRVVFTPRWEGALGSIMSVTLGGFNEKIVDPEAMAARYWADRPHSEQLAHNADLQRKALKMQADLLGRPVPKDVKKVIELNIQRTKIYSKWMEENGRVPNQSVKMKLDIDFLEKKGMLAEWEAAVLRREYDKIPVSKDGQQEALAANRLKAKIDLKTGAKAYIEWDDKVRAVARFEKYQNEIVSRDVAVLRQLGIWDKADPPKATDKEYIEMGRRYVDFKEEDSKRRKKITETTDSSTRKALKAEYLVWLMENPPLLEGFPSAPQVDTARLNPADIANTNKNHMFQQWAGLSYRDRQMLGKPVEPIVIKGWAAYQKTISEFQHRMPPGQRTIYKDQKDALAKAIGVQYPGFLEDYDFANKRLVDRIVEYKNFKADSKAKSTWNDIFKQASKAGKYLDNNEYPETLAKQAWHDYVLANEPIWEANDKQWAKELADIKKTKPTFLQDLLSRSSP